MSRRSGFTLIELVIVVVVAAALIGISTVAFGGIQNRLSAGQGIRNFKALHARARAQAIEGGQRTFLWVDTPGDSVWITRGGETLEVIRFDRELGVEITGTPNFFRLCMTPRGFADPDCNSFSNSAKLEFSQGAEAFAVEILPLGQLIES